MANRDDTEAELVDGVAAGKRVGVTAYVSLVVVQLIAFQETATVKQGLHLQLLTGEISALVHNVEFSIATF